MQQADSDALPSRPRFARRLAIALAVTAASVLAWPRLVAWQRGRLAEELAQRAVQSPDGSIASVRDMWQLGLPATAPLVELSTAQRPEVAIAAQEAISDQLAAWEVEFASGGDRELFGERLKQLSGSLRDNAGRFHWDGQLWAKKLARRTAQHGSVLEAEEAFVVLSACEQVLTTSELARPAAIVGVDEARSAKPQAAAAPGSVEARPLPAAAPVAVKPAADAPPTPPAELSVIMPSAEPLRAIDVSPEQSLPSIAEPLVVEDSLKITAVPNARPTPAGEGADVPSPLEMRHSQQRLRELSDRNLMAMIDTAPRFEAAAARQVLQTRGYSERLLELTRQLREQPAPQRRKALEQSAALPAADARRLLRWFVADEDADVRLHALTLLATTGDPQLAEIARERAIEDADPRVAELATKLLSTH